MVEKYRVFLFILVLILFACIRAIYAQPPHLVDNQPIKVLARVSQFPKIKGSNQSLVLEVIEPKNATLPATVTLRTRRYPEYKIGDMLVVEGKSDKYGILSFPKIIKQGNQIDSFTNALLSIRTSFQNSIQSALPEPHASLALGMLLGIENELPGNFDDALRRTGTIHMIVVSGFNITLVSSFILQLSGLLHRRYALLLAIVGTWVFVLISGAHPPALRAGLMATGVLIGHIYGRVSSSLYLLLISATLLIIFAPDLIYSISFQLSFAATAGVIILPPYLNQQVVELHKRFLKWIPLAGVNNPLLQKLKTYLREEGITTLSAQIAVAPLLLNSFGSFSLVAPLTNILVAWSVPYIMLTAFCLGLAGMISQVISQIIVVVPLVFTAYFLQIVYGTAALPFSYFQGIKINILVIVGIYVVLVSLIIKNRDNK